RALTARMSFPCLHRVPARCDERTWQSEATTSRQRESARLKAADWMTASKRFLLGGTVQVIYSNRETRSFRQFADSAKDRLIPRIWERWQASLARSCFARRQSLCPVWRPLPDLPDRPGSACSAAGLHL